MTAEEDVAWTSRFITPPDMHLTPGTVLRDAAGLHWMVRDDGQTAVGTNGGVMVDLRRGEVVFPAGEASPVRALLASWLLTLAAIIDNAQADCGGDDE